MALDLSTGGIMNPPIFDTIDPSKSLLFDFTGQSSGTAHTLAFSSTSNTKTTFPNISSDNVVLNATAATLTNKTMTSNTNNVLARGLFVNSGAASVSSFAAAVPSANQVLKTSSATTMAYVTQNLSTTLVDGNTTGNNNIQLTGTGGLVLTTTSNTITSSASVQLNILAGNASVAATAGGNVEIDGGDGLTTGGGGNITLSAGKSPTGTGGSIFLAPGNGAINGFINFQGFPYTTSIGTPTIAGGGAALGAGSTDYRGNISALSAGGTCTITYSAALAAGKRSHVQLTLTGVSGTTTPFFRVTVDSNTGFSVNNFSTAGTIAFNYFVVAWN